MQKGYFGDHSSRIGGSFLYRAVEIRHPISADFVYSGWWFLQRITIGETRVWSKISWLTINREVEFQLPKSVDPEQRRGKVEIDFGRGLSFRRFRIWIADELVYDEVV